MKKILHGWCRMLLFTIIALGNQSFVTRHLDPSTMLRVTVESRPSTALGMTKQQPQTQIAGTVSDSRGPLPGVTVSVKGTTVTTITDSNGAYAITAADGDILIFSFVGYKTVEVAADGGAVNIVMQEDATALQEVTVNAGYYKVKDKERTGSIAKITSKDIENQPVTNVLAAMQGRMAGVDIIQDSGTPGGGFQIKIRGINSLRAAGNEPLYIIDGVPFSSETIGATETSGFSPSMTNPLNSINPSEIESIEVLKDADATSIYGSRGANGVVLITTKKGKAGKTVFSVTASTAFGTVTKMLDLMNTEQYLAMRQEAYANDGVTTYPANAYDVNGTWDQTRYTDWQKELTGGTARIDNFQGSVSGGSASTQYLLSGTYRKETTVLPGDFHYDKGSAHFSMNHQSDDQKFKINFSGGYTVQKNNQPAADLTSISRRLAPNAPALYDGEGNLNWENNTWMNPLANLEGKFVSRVNALTANTALSYAILPELEVKANLGYNDVATDESKTAPSTMYTPAYGLGPESSSINVSNTKRRSWIIEPQLNWNRTFGKSKVEALGGGTFQMQRSNRLVVFGGNFTSNSLINDLASAAITNIIVSDETIYKYQAFFARLNYNYESRYIINVTGRRDGSSRFGPGKQFANFGAVGAAWLFSNERFLKNNSILSFGKVRASYGTSGNDQIGDYQFFDTYAASGNMYDGVNALQPVRLPNDQFGWETNKKFEVALETGFLKDRIFLTAAYYLNKSSNQLVGVPLPATTGFGSINANLDATVQNSGVEVTLRIVNFQTKDFSWVTNFNISAGRNKLLSFPGLESSPYANTYQIGESLSIYKLYHFTGMNPDTGIYEFEDVNGDGQITSLEDRQTIADLTPRYFGGLQNQLSYRNVKLDFLFQFVKQQNFGYAPGVPGTMVNQTTDAANHWTEVGDQAEYQPYTTGFNGAVFSGYYRYQASDGALTDASYIRLKNISLSYDVPLPAKNGIKCKLMLQGQNLLTFTPYKYGDPEFKFYGYLPPLKIYSAGVQLTF
jgi:TonB-linked SusC/RagA family outer membrane protein